MATVAPELRRVAPKGPHEGNVVIPPEDSRNHGSRERRCSKRQAISAEISWGISRKAQAGARRVRMIGAKANP